MATGMNGFAGPMAIVQDKYDSSMDFAERVMEDVKEFQKGLMDSIYTPPQISYSWSTLAAPNLPTVPNVPRMVLPDFQPPGAQPTPLTATMRDVQIDDVDVEVPALDFGVAPTLHIGTAPVMPKVRDVALPDVPVITMPAAPEFMQLTTHTFGGVNLHEDWLKKLEDIPILSLMEPAPFNYKPGQRYGSRLLENLKATLNRRIHGGTGLAAQVEQQIWDRARDREAKVARGNEQDVKRAAEALGFPLPSGVMAGQLADARQAYADKLSDLSREVAIKQADLEQQNMRETIDAALRLEGMLIDECYRYEKLVFEAAKVAAENALSANAAALSRFQALLTAYDAYSRAYDTIIKAELAKVEVFKALLSAEQVKADINQSLVNRYKAEIDSRMASVEIYKARVGAAQTLVEIEKTRIESGAEEIRGFVATVNAETAKQELYKSKITAEATKVSAVEAKARAHSAKVGAQAEKSRAEVAKYQALISAKGLEWDGYKTLIQAESARIDAQAKVSSISADAYRAGAQAIESQAASLMKRWEAEIAQYEAGKTLGFQVSKQNADAAIHAADARMEANKIALTTSAQQVASAWSAVSAQAEVGARVSETHSYSYP